MVRKGNNRRKNKANNQANNQDNVQDNDLHLLCEACHDMLLKFELSASHSTIDRGMKPHHRKKQDLATAAEAGCRICVAALAKAPETQTSEPFTIWSNRFDYINIWLAQVGTSAVVKFYWSGGPRQAYSGYNEIKTATSTSHESVLQLARFWLENCISSHKHGNCRTKGSTTWFPKRLLHVQGSNVSLITTQDQKPSGPYASLSHCWGKGQEFLVLTASNIRQLSEGIALTSLPKTFADALDVTRRLGFSYLWIDSLCILQSGHGSKEDWLEHATQMALVYENCIVNISADAAENPNYGLYSTRNPKLICELRQWGEETKKYRHFYLNEFCGYEALTSTKLAKRGWVVQERLLAPRVLHMGTLQAFWECSELPVACECHPDGPPDLAACLGGEFPFSIVGVSDHHKATDSGRKIRENFYEMIHHYTSCGLSFPDMDKLVAFAAIAKKITTRLNDEYVAGLLRSSLVENLLWEVSSKAPPGDTLHTPRGEYRAPTWSWASTDAPVRIEMRLAQPRFLAEVLSHQVNLIDPQNPFGRVASGTKLSLSGHLFTLNRSSSILTDLTEGSSDVTHSLSITVLDRLGILHNVRMERVQANMDEPALRLSDYEDVDVLLFPVLAYGEVDSDDEDDEDDEEEDGSESSGSSAYSEEEDDESEEDEVGFRGIFVEKHPQQSGYRRIGTWSPDTVSSVNFARLLNQIQDRKERDIFDLY